MDRENYIAPIVQAYIPEASHAEKLALTQELWALFDALYATFETRERSATDENARIGLAQGAKSSAKTMRTYFAYIRVSTIKQGEKGSSLTEQKDAILAYAQKHNLQIVEFFEEQQTGSQARPRCFSQDAHPALKEAAHGLIMHKVDRGARNLADWAEIAALKDIGIDVHFAHEAIDLNSRGGRLSADIQAVVASDLIRNLRDEVKKGIYGRLKQGIYPFFCAAWIQRQWQGRAQDH